MTHRKIVFQSLDEVAREIKTLASGPVKTTGKHDFPSIVRHLALSNDMMAGKIIPPKPPLIFRLLLPLIRSSILNGPVKPGFNLPKKANDFFWPSNPISLEDSVRMYDESVAYYKKHGPLSIHPVFGPASKEQVDSLNLKHAAMHLGFVQST
jgi:hypothetical protein